VDLQAPRKARRPAEQLLVEVVADPADRLRDEDRRGGRVQHPGDIRPPPSQDPDPDDHPPGDAPPAPQAALPDRERPPPGVRHLVPARDHVVEPPTDDPGRKAPQRTLLDELLGPTLRLPA